jgi:hypothetical protein
LGFVALLVLFVALLHWVAVAYNLFAWWLGGLVACWLVGCFCSPDSPPQVRTAVLNWGCAARIGIGKKGLFEKIR